MEVFKPQSIYFTTTIDNYWRVIFISKDDLTAHSLILDNNDALALQEWLESSQYSREPSVKLLEDEHIKVLLAPTADNPLFWTIHTDKLKQWHRKLGRARSSSSQTNAYDRHYKSAPEL